MPPTPVAYYQQIGRAGRAIDRAVVVALPRPVEDERIWRWFDSVSLPSEAICHEVLAQLSESSAMSLTRLEANVNMGRSRLTTLLSILDVQGAIRKVKGGWVRSPNDWQYDAELAERLRELRGEEAEQMRRYVDPPGCRLRYLRELLDDAGADDCGRCDRCGDGPSFVPPSPARAAEAQALLRGADIGIEPRRQWAPGLDEPKGRLAPEVQAQWGRALARLGDGGWDPIVADLLDGKTGEVPADLVQAIVGILKRWDWTARPTWVAALPSRRNATLIDAVAAEIGRLGKLPVFHPFVHDVDGAGFQSDQANSAFQLANVWGRLSVDLAGLPDAELRRGPVLLVDDSADSRWTLTVAAHLLTTSGTGPVLPFVLRAR